MFELKNDTSAYFDFKLVNDKLSSVVLNDYLEVSIDFSKSFFNVSGTKQSTEVVLPEITLNGLDNFFIPNGLIDGRIDTSIQYNFNVNDEFQFEPVSGYTRNINYEIETTTEYKRLKGGFFQGIFKLNEYPVTYFDLALSKGWSSNITIFHNPSGYTNTLNSIYPENSGFIFYLGARAENKYNEVTDIELEVIKKSFDFEFDPIRTTLATRGGEFKLNGEDYIGRYNYVDGQYWTGYSKDVTSEHIIKNYNYSDITNNAFGIRITDDGRIGYRSLTEKECDDKLTTVSGTTVPSYGWVTMTNCDGVSHNQLVTPDYKVIEQYSVLPVLATRINKYVNIIVVFERYFNVASRCELKYSKFRKGILKIFVNGVKVLNVENVDEVFARELDTIKELQEGVPYVMSVGGGTQGLYEAVYLDPMKKIDGVLEKYFAGTYTGALKDFSFYTIPANIPMVRKLATKTLKNLNIPINFGGRIITTY